MKRFTKIAFAILLLSYLLSFFCYGKWKDYIITGSDSWGYYAYLPATLIHHDLDSLDRSLAAKSRYGKHAHHDPANPLGIGEAHHYADGKQVIKYTYGTAFLNLPFFLAAHAVASVSGYESDGYSRPYMLFIHIAGLIYVFIGFFFLARVLSRYWEDHIVALVLLTVGLATNLYYFTVFNTAMAHPYLFFLYCMLIYSTVEWYEKGLLKHAILIGLTCGLITVSRPTELICLIIPFTYGIVGFTALKEKLLIFKKRYQHILIAAVIFILVGIPQFLYWKWITGDFLFYSYGDEKLNFLKPEIFLGLFGFKNGWLVYTPVMVLALAGILFQFKKRDFLWPVLIFTVLHIYIIYSWHNYMYINGLGSRPMVEAYALLAIPLGYLFDFFWKALAGRIFIISTLVFFGWLNIFQTYQFSENILLSEDGNKAYYLSIFGKSKREYKRLITFDTKEPQPDTSKLILKNALFFEDFEDTTNTNHSTLTYTSGKRSFHLKPEKQFSAPVIVNLNEFEITSGDWLRIGAMCRSEKGYQGLYHSTTIVSEFLTPDNQNLKWTGLRIENKIGNPDNSFYWGKAKVWGQVDFFVKVPENEEGGTLFKVYFWNPKGNETFIDDFFVEHWEK